MAETISRETAPPTENSFCLWLGLLGAPVAWLIQLELCYALANKACVGWPRWSLHAGGLFFLALAIGAGLLSWRNFKRAPKGETPDSDDSLFARASFMAQLGIQLSVLFSVLIIAQAIAGWLIEPCW
jgi:hypothetical protein